MSKHRVELLWFLLGLAALIAGVLVYILERNPDTVYFLSRSFSLFHTKLEIFGRHGDYLPTLLHSFALILMTAAAIGKHKVSAITVTLFWMLIEIVFELAQTQFIGSLIVSHIPQWFESVPVLENTYRYFRYGNFNTMDMASIVVGSAAAYVLIQLTKRSNNNEALEIQTV